MPGAKSSTSEAGVCVPFIASWPGTIKANSTTEALVDFTDILPTFMEITGMDWEKVNEQHIIDGVSFYQVLTGSIKSSRPWILSMGGGNHARLTDEGVQNQYRFRDRVLRNQRFKLYLGSDRKPEKLYDLKEDPQEKVNLLGAPLTDLQQHNLEELLEIAKEFPTEDNDPRYRSNPSRPWDVEVTAESQIWKK